MPKKVTPFCSTRSQRAEKVGYLGLPEEKWNAIVAVNLSAAFHTRKAVLPGMRERKWGRIINIASVHGLVGLSEVTALETARNGITCNAICPGYVEMAAAIAMDGGWATI